jgi:hypothetical protein
MKEITIKLTDKEYHQYVRKGQSEYRIRMKKAIEDEDYVKWMFMLGEYYRGQCAQDASEYRFCEATRDSHIDSPILRKT